MYILAQTKPSDYVVVAALLGIILVVIYFWNLIQLGFYQWRLSVETRKKEELEWQVKQKRQRYRNFVARFPEKEMTQEEFDALPVASQELLQGAQDHYYKWFRFPPCDITGEHIVGQFVPFEKMLCSQQGGATGSSPLYNRYRIRLIDPQVT